MEISVWFLNMDLIDAIIKNNVKRVKELLEQGVDPNQTDDWANITPLHYAAFNNSLEIATMLIAAGAKINVRDQIDNESPLDVAKLQGNEAMIKLLSCSYEILDAEKEW